MENKKEFLNIMNSVALIYDRKFSKAVLDMYWMLLREESFVEFKNAMQQICRTSKFWPKPSEIIDVIEKSKGPVGIEAQAEQQWRVVVNAVRVHGISREPGFEDAKTAWLIKKQFGWGYLCDIKQNDEKWEQKRFCRSYELLAESEMSGGGFRIEDIPGKLKQLTTGMLNEVK